ncbi:hypothetical protein DPMN_152615 [Dreissena polymorpha]|uniref:Uncharacterized protein n=1 Tax=Dreissena polymorpha TaxID=45954 RepID=A0A9D4J410_DREPO|nr:hypothetical protein DPMN_152615 [Dreissena polymorpha]
MMITSPSGLAATTTSARVAQCRWMRDHDGLPLRFDLYIHRPHWKRKKVQRCQIRDNCLPLGFDLHSPTIRPHWQRKGV